MVRRQAEKLYESGKEPTVAKLLEQDAEVQELKRKIANLEKDSTNSSKPPSTDKPGEKGSKPTKKKKKKKRKPGGQPGHKGSHRNLIPVDEVDEVIAHYPDKCKDCGKELPQDETANVIGDPFRWQVTEIEPIIPKVEEHQCHTTQCDCGCHTTAILPPEVAKSNFGSRLTAIVAYMTGVLRVPRRGIREFCETLLNIKVALGSVQNLLQTTSTALEPADKQLKDALPKEPVINADETGWRDRWLWIFVASTFIYFHVAKTRSFNALVDVLGQVYQGILCVDRWGAYTKYHKGLIQFCWAHLKRDFLGVLKIGQKTDSKEAVNFADTMEKLRKRLMAIWYRFKREDISRAELVKKARPIKAAIKRCLINHMHSEEKCGRSLARNLFKHFDKLFTFIYHEGVEPTNNSAERGIRPAVQWRKICFGNRSDKGAVLTSRLLTVSRTCWLQNRNPLEFLADTITAHRRGEPVPSLL